MSDRLFRDRRDAGRVLAGLLEHHRGRPDVVVLGLARGGVPVAHDIARALDAPLDVFVVRKLGVPSREELAMGAIASGGVVVINDDLVRGLRISPEVIQRIAEQEGRELLRREQAYRGGRPMPDLAGKTVILVDDGLATGSSMRAAIQALRQAPAGQDRRRCAGGAAVHLPGTHRTRRRGGLRHHPVAVFRGRPVVLGLQPDHRRRGAGPAARRGEVGAGPSGGAGSHGGGGHPGSGAAYRERRAV